MKMLVLVSTFLVASLTGLSAEDDFRFSISPNPASSSVQIHTDFTGDVKVELYSVIGNRILSQDFSAQDGENIKLNISKIPEGIYIVKVTAGNRSSAKRLKIQHS